MLCPTCPKRSTCRSVCKELEDELMRIERPCREIPVAPNYLEKLSAIHICNEFYKNAEELVEEAEEEESPLDQFSPEQIKEAMSLLTEKQRICIRLFYWWDLSQYEIAEKLVISRSTVVNHLQAGHRIIRQYLIESLKTPIQPALYK